MHRLLSLALPLLGSLTSAQQIEPNRDLREILNAADWAIDEIGPEVVLRRALFDSLFGSPQSVAVIRARRGTRLDVVQSTGLEATSSLAVRHDALVAINGGFFNTKNGDPVGLLRVDENLVQGANEGQASVGVTGDGKVILGVRPAGDWPKSVDALGAGPMLLVDGEVVDHGERQRKIRHPRSAIGLTARDELILLVVDGRTPKAAGMSFEELGAFMAALGCRDALNLDGGGSSTLWALGRGIVNHPCDNKKFDAEGERKVANAVLLSGAVRYRFDEEAATISSGVGKRREGLANAIDTDALVIERGPDGSAPAAIFALRAPRPGRYRIDVLLPRLEGLPLSRAFAVLGDARATIVPSRNVSDWRSIGTFDFGSEACELRLEATTETALVVDAVRLTERPRGD
ncbi:MAG: phosphodiester glycosidase family protein [Planctomycetota bacterium]